MEIIKTKKDIAAYIKKSPIVVETKKAYEADDAGDFKEVEEELVCLIAGSRSAPEFGDDWEAWLRDNINELLEDAVSIVM